MKECTKVLLCNQKNKPTYKKKFFEVCYSDFIVRITKRLVVITNRFFVSGLLFRLVINFIDYLLSRLIVFIFVP